MQRESKEHKKEHSKIRTAPLLHNFCKIHSNRCVMKFFASNWKKFNALMSCFLHHFVANFLQNTMAFSICTLNNLEDFASRFIFSICPSQGDGYHVLLVAWLGGIFVFGLWFQLATQSLLISKNGKLEFFFWFIMFWWESNKCFKRLSFFSCSSTSDY